MQQRRWQPASMLLLETLSWSPCLLAQFRAVGVGLSGGSSTLVGVSVLVLCIYVCAVCQIKVWCLPGGDRAERRRQYVGRARAMALHNLLAVDPCWQLAGSVAGATCQAAVLHIYTLVYSCATQNTGIPFQVAATKTKKSVFYTVPCLLSTFVCMSWLSRSCVHTKRGGLPTFLLVLRGIGPD